MSFETSALIVTWAALLLMALVVSGLVRQVHALSAGGARRTGQIGPRPGTPAPDLARLDARAPAVLLFLSEDCRTCAAVLAEAGRLAPDRSGEPALHALYAGAVPVESAHSPAGGVTVHGYQAELFDRYDAVVTPFAVTVGHNGRVARSEPIGSPAALRALLNRLEDQVGGRP